MVISMDPFTFFLVSALLAGLVATSTGGIPILFMRDEFSHRKFDIGNAIAAGIMLASSIFSLLIPGMELGGTVSVSIGFIIGVLFVLLLKDRVHVFYYKLTGETASPALTKALIIFSALTLHNMPEGMSVGVAFASGSLILGVEVAIAIGIQNIPEGFAVAAPLYSSGFSKRKAFSFSVFSGLVEPLNAILVYFIVSLVHGLLPYFFGFCAGAMMFVVINEMIPEAQHGEYFDKSTLAVMAGFLLMLILDTMLG